VLAGSTTRLAVRKKSQKFATPQSSAQIAIMDYARSPIRPVTSRKLRTGPLPTVPWRELDRKTSIEHHLPALILLGFGILATIQILLSQ